MTRCSDGPITEVASGSVDDRSPADRFSDLAAAMIMPLQSAVDEAITAHRTGCPWCTTATRRDCPLLGLATAIVDLIIHCWRITKAMQYETSGCAPRDLHAAVLSGWLSDAESAKLTQILGVLDLAATQADAAGIKLPMLAGIGIAVIDSYRDITTAEPVR